jgi:VIT1/CCC1 family predicted Fe2+/Mn2+ transporter
MTPLEFGVQVLKGVIAAAIVVVWIFFGDDSHAAAWTSLALILAFTADAVAVAMWREGQTVARKSGQPL